MATEQITRVLRHVQQMIGLRRGEELTDGDLLDRFVSHYDEAAFEALVRRHGPMVQRVGRRVLGDAHAAEDAFQATFLVLAKKASSIRERRSIAGWLYEVAYNLALRARASSARRREHERRAGEMPKPQTTPPSDDPELHAALDEELHRLPEKFRTPLVLCYLEGKTNEEAARELGWPSGSMSYRLSQAREMLRKRLSSRGVALPAAGLLVLLSESAAPGAVSSILVKSTVRAAAQFAAGKAIAAGAVSADAVALAEGALHTMLTTKVKIAAGLLLAVGLLGTGTGVLVSADTAPKAVAPVDPKANPATEDKSGGVDAFGDPLPAGAISRLGTLRWRHNSPILFAAYAADSKQIITVCQDGAIRVLEADSGKEVNKFGKIWNPNNPNLPPGVDRVVPGVQPKVIPVNPAGGAAPGGAQAAPAIAPAPAVKPAPAAPAVPVGPAVAPLPPMVIQAQPTSVALSPDTKTLLVAGSDGSFTLWEVATGKEVRSFKPNPPMPANFMTFVPDGKSFFARTYDTYFRQYDLEGKELAKVGTPPNPQGRIGFFFTPNAGMTVSPDGKTLVACAVENNFGNGMNEITGLLKSYEIATGKETTLKGPKGPTGFTTVAVAPDGKTVAFGIHTGVVHVWDMVAGKEIQKLTGAVNDHPAAAVFSADSKTLAVRSGIDQVIHLWSVAEGKELQKVGDLPDANAKNAINGFVGRGWVQSHPAFAPNGGLILTATDANTLRQFDTKSGKEVAIQTAGHHGGITAVALSPDGKTAVTRGIDNTVHIWEADNGKETKRYPLPGNTQFAAFTADGKTLALGCMDGSVIIWDVAAGKEIKSWKAGAQEGQGFATMALSPDGKTLAVRGYDQNIKLWDVANAKELRQVADLSGNKLEEGERAVVALIAIMPGMQNTQNLVFSPDGTLLVGMAQEKMDNPGVDGPAPGLKRPFPGRGFNMTMRLWDVSTGKQVRKFEGSQNAGVAGFAFAPDGRTIATANNDGSISLWEAASGKERTRIAFKPAGQAAVPVPMDKETNKAVAVAAVQPAAAQPAVMPVGGPVVAVQPILRPGFAVNQGMACIAFSPDGKVLAAAGQDGFVHFWDMAVSKERTALKGHQSAIASLAFATSGKRIVTGSNDTTALVWEVPAQGEKPPVLTVEAEQAKLLVNDLTEADAAKAYAAIRILSQVPKTSVPLLKDKVDVVPAPDAQKLAQLIADLDSNAFVKRKKAEEELEKMGELAEDALRKGLESKPGPEVQKTLEGLLAKLVTGGVPSASQLRSLRVMEILEAAGTPEAQEILKSIAKGAPGARITKDARAALDRLGQR